MFLIHPPSFSHSFLFTQLNIFFPNSYPLWYISFFLLSLLPSYMPFFPSFHHSFIHSFIVSSLLSFHPLFVLLLTLLPFSFSFYRFSRSIFTLSPIHHRITITNFLIFSCPPKLLSSPAVLSPHSTFSSSLIHSSIYSRSFSRYSTRLHFRSFPLNRLVICFHFLSLFIAFPSSFTVTHICYSLYLFARTLSLRLHPAPVSLSRFSLISSFLHG